MHCNIFIVKLTLVLIIINNFQKEFIAKLMCFVLLKYFQCSIYCHNVMIVQYDNLYAGDLFACLFINA